MSSDSSYQNIQCILTSEDCGNRLDSVLARHIPLSRRRIRKAINDGGVYVNKRRCRKAGINVRGNEHIRVVALEGETLIPFEPEQIIWQQETLILLHKRAGQYAQEALHRSLGTLPVELASHLGLTGEAARELRPVHRLDRGTSGLMLFSASPKQLQHLQTHWHTNVDKAYLAVVEPAPAWSNMRISTPISKHRNIHGCYRVDENGRPCDTRASVIQQRDNRALVKLVPHTGRTHQLRVHLASSGCPILGDTRYGGKPHTRMMLHAYHLCVHPPALPATHEWQIDTEEDWKW